MAGDALAAAGAGLVVPVLGLLASVWLRHRSVYASGAAAAPVRCIFDSPVTITSQRGQHLAEIGGKLLLAGGTSAGTSWTVLAVDDQFVSLRSTTGLYLQDTDGTPLFSRSATTPNEWWMVQDAGDERFFLKSVRNGNLADADGIVRLRPTLDGWDKWRVRTPSGSPVSTAVCASAPHLLNSDWTSPRNQTPDVIPAPSELASYDWPQPRPVSEQDVQFFDTHGYAVLRQVVDPKVMDILLNESRSFCSAQFLRRGICQIEQLRWQANSFRDFLLHGPLGALVHPFMKSGAAGGASSSVLGVRVESEALFGVQHNDVDPTFFSYLLHVDTMVGVFHSFATGTPGVAVWFPLHDVDHVEQGGGIKVISGYPYHECKWRECGGIVTPTSRMGPKNYSCSIDQCKETFAFSECDPRINLCKECEQAHVLSFKKGDIAVLHPDMPHATQRVLDKSFKRYGFTIRFVDSEAIQCNVAHSCGTWMACCRDSFMQSGHKIHSHCYPQVYPKVLDQEVRAHYSTSPKHLMADPALEEAIHSAPISAECA